MQSNVTSYPQTYPQALEVKMLLSGSILRGMCRAVTQFNVLVMSGHYRYTRR